MAKSAVILTALHKESKELPGRYATITKLAAGSAEIAVNRLFGAMAAGKITVRENIAIVRNAPKGSKHLLRKPVFPAADIQTRRTESRRPQP